MLLCHESEAGSLNSLKYKAEQWVWKVSQHAQTPKQLQLWRLLHCKNIFIVAHWRVAASLLYYTHHLLASDVRLQANMNLAAGPVTSFHLLWPQTHWTYIVQITQNISFHARFSDMISFTVYCAKNDSKIFLNISEFIETN